MQHHSSEESNQFPADEYRPLSRRSHRPEEGPAKVEELVAVDFRGEDILWITPLPDTGLFDEPQLATRFRRIVERAFCENETLVIDLTETNGDRDLIRQEIAGIAIKHNKGREQLQGNSGEIIVIDNKYDFKNWAHKTGFDNLLLILSSVEALPDEIALTPQNADKNNAFSTIIAVQLSAEFADKNEQFRNYFSRQSLLWQESLRPVGQATHFACIGPDTITFQISDEFISQGGNLADHSCVEKLQEELEVITLAGLAQHRKLIFDLGGIKRVSKEGIGALIVTVRGVREQRERARLLLADDPEAEVIPGDDRATLQNVHPIVRDKFERLGVMGPFFRYDVE